MPKISFLCALELVRTSELNIYVNSELHTENDENQHPSLLNSGDSYEEDLKLMSWKETSI